MSIDSCFVLDDDAVCVTHRKTCRILSHNLIFHKHYVLLIKWNKTIKASHMCAFQTIFTDNDLYNHIESETWFLRNFIFSFSDFMSSEGFCNKYSTSRRTYLLPVIFYHVDGAVLRMTNHNLFQMIKFVFDISVSW